MNYEVQIAELMGRVRALEEEVANLKTELKEHDEIWVEQVELNQSILNLAKSMQERHSRF